MTAALTAVCALLLLAIAYAERPTSSRSSIGQQGHLTQARRLLQYPGYDSDAVTNSASASQESLPYYSADTDNVYWNDDDFLFGAGDGSGDSSPYPLRYTPPFAYSGACTPPQASPPPQQSPPASSPPVARPSPPPPSPVPAPVAQSPPVNTAAPLQSNASHTADSNSSASPLPSSAVTTYSPAPAVNATQSISPSPSEQSPPVRPPQQNSSEPPAVQQASPPPAVQQASPPPANASFQQPLQPLPPLSSPSGQSQNQSTAQASPSPSPSPANHSSPPAANTSATVTAQPPAAAPSATKQSANASSNGTSFSYDVFFNQTKSFIDVYNCTDPNIAAAVQYATLKGQSPEVANNATARSECNLLEHKQYGYPVDWRDYIKPKADGSYDCSDPALEHALDAMEDNGHYAQGYNGITVESACETLQYNHSYNLTVEP